MRDEQRIERQKNFLIQATFVVVWLAIIWLFIKAAGSVLLPFVIAFAVAWVLAYPVDFITEKLHVKRYLAAVFVVGIFYFVLGCIVYFAGSRLIGLIQDLMHEWGDYFTQTVSPMLQNFFAWLENVFGGLFSTVSNAVGSAVENAGDFSANGAVGKAVNSARGGSGRDAASIERASEVLSKISDGAIDGISKAATGIPGFLTNLLITVIATVFTELEFHQVIRFCRNQIPDRYLRMFQAGKGYVTGTLGKCILSYCLIMGMTFLELWTGLALLGIEGAFVIAFVIAVLDILPVIGTGTVLIPWSVLAFAGGNLKIGIGIMVLYLVITIVRNIVEPKLVGRQMGLSPVVMLPCMLVGLKLFGIVGLFVIPFGVAFIKSLNDAGVIHIFRGDSDA